MSIVLDQSCAFEEMSAFTRQIDEVHKLSVIMYVPAKSKSEVTFYALNTSMLSQRVL